MQNKDSLEIQLKLNELMVVHEFASKRLVNVENMSEEEMKVIQKYYCSLSKMTRSEESLQQSYSIDDAKNMNQIKKHRQEDMLDDLK